MASIRESRGRLFLDYRLNGKRQRVYVKLPDSVANREQLQRVAKQVDATLAASGDVLALLTTLGLLDDATDTPATELMPLPLAVPKATVVSFTPLFSTFAEQWFGEFKVGWCGEWVPPGT
mgnify:CR=1 FL=1